MNYSPWTDSDSRKKKKKFYPRDLPTSFFPRIFNHISHQMIIITIYFSEHFISLLVRVGIKVDLRTFFFDMQEETMITKDRGSSYDSTKLGDSQMTN